MKWFWVIWLLILPVVIGAEIHGTVYDFGLSVLPNSIVEINTTPKQQMVAKDGNYSFSVSKGNYALTARNEKSDSSISENISVPSEGNYVLDLILFPSLEKDEELLVEVPDVPMIEDVLQDRPASSWLIWVAVFAILGYLVYKVSRKPVIERVVEKIKEIKEVPVQDELEKILQLIEKEGGRITQKDIRKNFPYSEAKISLMIDELEAKGLVKKVKKGRGNVILRV